MKKYVIKESELGKKIMSKVGVFILDEKLSQKDIKKLYNAGFTNIIDVVEKKDEPKED